MGRGGCKQMGGSYKRVEFAREGSVVNGDTLSN